MRGWFDLRVIIRCSYNAHSIDVKIRPTFLDWYVFVACRCVCSYTSLNSLVGWWVYGGSQVPASAYENVIFPLGDSPKSLVRDIAEANGLVVAKKKESMGVCFIGQRNFSTFLEQYLTLTPGWLVDLNGKVLETHTGMEKYTIGQRAPIPGADRYYVCLKNQTERLLTAVPGRHHPALFFDHFRIADVTWITPGGLPPAPLYPLSAAAAATAAGTNGLRCLARYESQSAMYPCTITARWNGEMIRDYEVRFDEPQRCVVLGQALVLYEMPASGTPPTNGDGSERCLGGGSIDWVAPSVYHRTMHIQPDAHIPEALRNISALKPKPRPNPNSRHLQHQRQHQHRPTRLPRPSAQQLPEGSKVVLE